MIPLTILRQESCSVSTQEFPPVALPVGIGSHALVPANQASYYQGVSKAAFQTVANDYLSRFVTSARLRGVA